MNLITTIRTEVRKVLSASKRPLSADRCKTFSQVSRARHALEYWRDKGSVRLNIHNDWEVN